MVVERSRNSAKNRAMRYLLTALAALTLATGPVLADGLLSPMGAIAAEQRAHLILVTAVTMSAVLPVLIGVPILRIAVISEKLPRSWIKVPRFAPAALSKPVLS